MNYLTQKRLISFLSVFILLFLSSCSDDNDDELGNWVESSSFDGDSRSSAVSFTIGTKGYLITGYDGDDYLTDNWEYNSDSDFWVEKTSFPGTPRSGAVGFSLNGKGYIGTGYDGDNELNDFWEYDPTTDSWTQKADFPGTARYNAIGFSIGENGYIGTGYDGSEQKDFWKYNPTTNTWEQALGFGGQKRQEASVFTINNVAYIVGGVHNGAYEEDFYSFDGTTWKRLTDIDDDDNDHQILFSNSAAISFNGKGYISTGIDNTISTKTWVYTPETDTWDDMPNFEGSARQDASAFVFDEKTYVLMGRSSNFYYDDVWEFRPEEIENEDD
ncbi:N-acetylneuraminic acid mutarotase [Wenyingzhuangia heitensis]|uniref:N-acetylneuraminic acid mutarotase n=1 Tax=Wenyingzhuangia heitensis TaxID=1487859 RepID=A0ABX0U7D5_9FLAO|nr:kelch repeat-containing protein [Wenyingzhuangia heitensis]NIJ44744.1 N-acetylneuraminic acid mutarotase [Wenyingzhuangia heitensis]